MTIALNAGSASVTFDSAAGDTFSQASGTSLYDLNRSDMSGKGRLDGGFAHTTYGRWAKGAVRAAAGAVRVPFTCETTPVSGMPAAGSRGTATYTGKAICYSTHSRSTTQVVMTASRT
ncbi:MAG: hypothetical protein AAGK98_12690 [Pseudomonadota bacterium]